MFSGLFLWYITNISKRRHNTNSSRHPHTLRTYRMATCVRQVDGAQQLRDRRSERERARERGRPETNAHSARGAAPIINRVGAGERRGAASLSNGFQFAARLRVCPDSRAANRAEGRGPRSCSAPSAASCLARHHTVGEGAILQYRCSGLFKSLTQLLCSWKSPNFQPMQSLIRDGWLQRIIREREFSQNFRCALIISKLSFHAYFNPYG